MRSVCGDETRGDGLKCQKTKYPKIRFFCKIFILNLKFRSFEQKNKTLNFPSSISLHFLASPLNLHFTSFLFMLCAPQKHISLLFIENGKFVLFAKCLACMCVCEWVSIEAKLWETEGRKQRERENKMGREMENR